MENDEPLAYSADDSGAHASSAGDSGVRELGADGVGDGLLDRVGLIEAQPLDQRARGFEQLHDELLADLQRGDHQGAE